MTIIRLENTNGNIIAEHITEYDADELTEKCTAGGKIYEKTTFRNHIQTYGECPFVDILHVTDFVNNSCPWR
jgi:hypothetical protein